MKLSACFIVKNEAEHLADSINSVKNCAEELIVVDTGSADDTVQIARNCGASIFYFEWIDDFSAARNFALSLAKGDYVIFIDADEYFSPPLSAIDRSVIVNTFIKSNVEALVVPRIEINAETKEELLAIPHGRIFKRGSIHYEHKVHEMAVLKNGGIPKAIMLKQYRLMHLWYGAERDAAKLRRNIKVLKAEQSELSSDFDLFNSHAYLLREYMALDDYENAFVSCRYLLDNYPVWQKVCSAFLPDYIQRFYAVIRLAAALRFRFNRRELYKKIFCEIKKNYPTSREAAFADLYYSLIFNYREEIFLKQLDKVMKRIEKLPPSLCPESEQAEALIYGRAALAAYCRGEEEKCRRLIDCALNAIPVSEKENMREMLAQNFKNTERGIGGEILRGEYEKAYANISAELQKGSLDNRLLEFLLIIAEKTESEA